MRRIFAVKIDIAGEVFRFATDRVEITEEIGSQTFVIPYIPYIMKISPVKSAVSIDGKPPIPNTNIVVWDGYSELRDAFENIEFEGADCTVFFVDTETDSQKSFEGYLTNFKHSDGQASFNVRQEEDKGSQSLLKQFKHDSFENFFVATPGNLEVEPQWSVYENTPWTVDDVFLHRSELSRPYLVGDQFLYIKSTKSHPNGHPTDRNLLIKRNYSDDVLDLELTFSGSTITRDSGDWTVPRDGGTGYQVGDVIEIIGTAFNDGRYVVDSFPSALDMTLTTPVTGEGPISGVTMYYYDNFQLIDSTSNLNWIWVDDPPGTKRPFDYSIDSPMGGPQKRESCRQSGSPWTLVNDDKEIRIPVTTLTASLRLNSNHRKGSIVTMTRPKKHAGVDRVVVNTNGRVPPSEVQSANSVGFFYAGQNSKNPISNKVFREFHRFVWASQDVDRDLIPETDPILRSFSDGQVYIELDIHNNTRSWAKQVFAIDRKDTYAFINEYEQGTPIKLADFVWTISHMDVIIDNLDQDTRDSLTGVDFLNRVKGNRVDMLNSFAELKHTLLTAANNPDAVVSETHNKLLNNASGQFGVVLESQIVEDETTRTIFERLFFSVNNRAGAEVADTTVDDETEDAGFEWNAEPSEGNDQAFSNFFKYGDGLFDRASQTEEAPSVYGEAGDLGEQDAKDFFLSKKYRIILDPVPENSKDLGKFFPIVYGFVERVPMLQVISKKVLKEDTLTAGDDTYVYCSHPCDVNSPLDIRIELLDETKKEGRAQPDSEGQLPLVVDDFIDSPFPYVAYNHTAIDDVGGNEERRNVPLLYNPYHNVTEIRTLDGFKLNAVKLRGEEWDPRLGRSDKRYPIRNGVGSSTLYASFGGWVDDTGEITGAAGSLINHPIDILRHFVTTYGRYPFTDPEKIFDIENLDRLKSLTRRMEASVFLSEDMLISEFISKIADEFGLLWFLKDGKIKLALSDTDVVDYTKLVSEKFNLMNKMQEVDKGAGKVYSRVLFNYKRNWVTGQYDATVDLNRTNNEFCARAAKALGGKTEFKINADFVRSAAVATDVATRIASRVSAHQVQYQAEVRYTGVEFEPGDVVPVTYSPFGFLNQPMLIKSVTEDRDLIKMELIRFI